MEWVARSFSRGSSWPRGCTGSPTLQEDPLPSEPPGKPLEVGCIAYKWRACVIQWRVYCTELSQGSLVLGNFLEMFCIQRQNISEELLWNHGWSTEALVWFEIMQKKAFLSWRRLLRVPWTARRSNPINPKGNEYSLARTDAEAEAPILRPPDAKSWFIGKDSDAGEDWGQEEKGAREVEIVGWYRWLDGHESEQTWGDGDGQGSLVCCVHGVTKGWTRLSDWATTEQRTQHKF